jgi:hypothetical protein
VIGPPLPCYAYRGNHAGPDVVTGLAKLAGSLWHAYRRAWATSRKNHPLKDVAAAGGWRDTETLLQVYQQPTNEALLAVMSEERKVRDVSVAGGNG